MSKFNVTSYDANAIVPKGRKRDERIEVIDTATNAVFGYETDLDCDEVKECFEAFWEGNRFGELITVSKVEKIEVLKTVEFGKQRDEVFREEHYGVKAVYDDDGIFMHTEEVV